MRKLNTPVWVLLVLPLLYSCNGNRVFEENREIEKSLWSSENTLVFDVSITDTISLHSVYLNVRNAGVYPYSNLFLFINTRFPDGQMDRDTVEITLAGSDGAWLGEGLGDIWDNRVLFRKSLRFPQSGEYRFELIQAMRQDPLPGIMDAGIRIEKSAEQ